MHGNLKNFESLTIKVNYYQLVRESAISNKWLIISLSIAVTLFFHFISAGSPNSSIWDFLSKPGPIFVVILAITYANGILRNLISILGSFVDKNKIQEYHILKPGNAF